MRLAIVMPIALGVIDACKLEYNSKGSAFIALIAFAMCLFPGTGWLTGSLSGPIMTGFLPSDLRPLATFDNWFKILALPWFIVTVVYVALVVVLMKPKEAIGIPRDTFKEEYVALGPISRQEIITTVILVACLVLFTTEKLHGIPAAGAALMALVLLLLFGIIKPPGMWANTCCGHPRPGESLEAAAHRRLQEEMGFDTRMVKAFSFIYKAEFENGLTEKEYDHVFVGQWDGIPERNIKEVADYKWIPKDVLNEDLKKNPETYTTWFKTAWEILLTKTGDRHKKGILRTPESPLS